MKAEAGHATAKKAKINEFDLTSGICKITRKLLMIKILTKDDRENAQRS